MELNIVINARFLTQKLTGVQRFAIEIARQLKALEPSVKFVAPPGIIHHQLAAELEVVVIGRRGGVVWEQIDLPLYLKRKGRPLLLNLCNVAPLFYSNQVITLHDMAFFANPTWFSKNFVRYYQFIIPLISKKARMIFTVSEFSKSEIIKYTGVDAQKIKVVYNGVSRLSEPGPADESYGRYILTVGSIDKRKNISNLIEAFRLISDNTLKLIVVGDVNSIFNNQGNEMLKTNGNIIFTGRVDDMRLATLYAQAQMFVYPSLYEGFGIPPVEAMQHGCPVLISNIPSLREVCGDAGAYIDPLDIHDIANGITRLVNNNALRNSLIEKGKQNITRFNWQASAGQILNSVKSLIVQI